MRQVKKTPRLTVLAALGACLLALGPGAIPAAADAPAGDDATSEADLSRSPRVSVTTAKVVEEFLDLGMDVLVLRPLGALSTLVGAAFFVVSLPVTVAAEQTEIAKEVLIDTPFQETFGRPLGAI